MATRSARVGVHGRNDYWECKFEERDYDVVREARIEHVKMTISDRAANPAVLNNAAGAYQRLREINPDMDFVVRLDDPHHANAGGHPTPQEFANRFTPIMNGLHDRCPYVVKFEVLNEPNHPPDPGQVGGRGGWGPEADLARDFSRWFLETYDLLKAACPWASLGFPGLAIPHGNFPDKDLGWAEACRPAVERADWLGVHCYWQNPTYTERNHMADFWGLRSKAYHDKFPDKVIEITEFGNSNGQSGYPVEPDKIAREYVEYYQVLFNYPYINSAASFIMSSIDPKWGDEGFTWRKESGEFWPVVRLVGAMPRPPLVPAEVVPLVPAEVVPLVPAVVELTPQEEIAQLQKEAQELRRRLATSRTTATRREEEARRLRQQVAASQETVIQLQRQVDALRQQLVTATTPTPVHTPPVTTPATPVVTTPVVTPPPVTTPATPVVTTPVVTPPPATPSAITLPPMDDVTARLRRHPVKRFESRTLDRIKYLVIQHSVLPGNFPPERIANYLVEKRQWPGIGYHFYITSDGKIYQTNHLDTVCYFAGSSAQYNPLGVCICFAGDFTAEVPTAAQLSSGGKLLAFLMRELRLSEGSIRGQKEFVATQSPGQQWDGGRKWKGMLLAKVRAAQS